MEHRQGVSREKAKLESEKLELEIKALRRPFRTNPAHWISAVTAVLAITAVFFQYRLSRSEFILAESKSVQAKIETEKAQESTKALRNEIAKLQEEIADKSKRRDQLEALVRNADSLLSKAADTADPNLRRDIDKLRETTRPSSPFWSSLPAILDQPQLKEAANVERLLHEADAEVRRVRGEIREKELGKLSDSQTGYNADFKNHRLQNQLAFIKPGYQQPK
jgi:cell division protein FtsB